MKQNLKGKQITENFNQIGLAVAEIKVHNKGAHRKTDKNSKNC